MKVNGADGYKVYFSSCNTNDSYETCRLVKTINNNNTFKYTKSSLKKGNLYKAYVSAFKSVNGKKVEIGKSKGTCKIHIIALNGVNTTIRVTVR